MLFGVNNANAQEQESKQYKLPDDICAAFDDEKWTDYQPVFPKWYTVESGYQNGSFYPVIMKKDEHNVLCVLTKQDNKWIIAFSNEHALYAGDILPESITYYVAPNVGDISKNSDQDFDIIYTFDPPVDNRKEIAYLFAFSDGEWKLRVAQVFYEPTIGHYVDNRDYRETKIYPAQGNLVFREILNEKDVPPDHKLKYNSSYKLDEFNIDLLPLSYK
jgi:hypothetical protein